MTENRQVRVSYWYLMQSTQAAVIGMDQKRENREEEREGEKEEEEEDEEEEK